MATKPDRRKRMALILERDGPACVWCGREIAAGLVEATTEHVVPRIKGGPSWIENEVAACRRCNGQRGHRTPGEWIDECERRGWQPSRQTIVAVLSTLDEAIEARGGQRRARAYARSQLRRLAQAERPSTPAMPHADSEGRVIGRDWIGRPGHKVRWTGTRSPRRSS